MKQIHIETLHKIRALLNENEMSYDEMEEFHKEVARLIPLQNAYNGWPNAETWHVALMLDNSEATHNKAREIVETAENEFRAADALQAWVYRYAPNYDDPIVNPVVNRYGFSGIQGKRNKVIRDDMNSIMYQSIMYSLDSVKWDRIVQHFKSE